MVYGTTVKLAGIKVLAVTKQPVVDPEGVSWNPSFEGLPSTVLCAIVYYVHYAHTGATHFSFKVAKTHVCQLNNFLYQEFDVRVAYVCI